MKIAIIITAIIFLYFEFSTIFQGSNLVGNLGDFMGSANRELFGFFAYLNFFVLFYPLYRLYTEPKLAKRLDFYAGWLLFLISMAILPALIFDKPESGMISEELSAVFLPSIGKLGLWLLWLMTILLSLVLVMDDDFCFQTFMDDLRDGQYMTNITLPDVSWSDVVGVAKKLAVNPFAISSEEIMLSDMEFKKPAKDTELLPESFEVKSIAQGATKQRHGKGKISHTEKSKHITGKVKLKRENPPKEVVEDLIKVDSAEANPMKEDPLFEIKQKLAASNSVEIIEELEENSRLLNEMEKGEMDKPRNFKLPKLEFLKKSPRTSRKINEAEIDRKIGELLDKLGRFNIEGDVVRTYSGPVVTTFEFKPAPNVKISKIMNLQDDLAMALSAETIRIQAPIPGRDVVGIEIPNEVIETIYLRDILESPIFLESKSPLTIALGKDIVGKPFITDLKRLPHLLIAGTTGSGKSVGINAMLLSLLYRNDPEQLKLVLIDPKMLEFSIYNDIPHLLTPVITEPKKAISALANLVSEMERRYRLMSESKVKNIDSYNDKMKLEYGIAMPFIVIVIDELADLMMNGGKEVEYSIARLAQMARASGIHLIVATQRPSVDVVTGLIKANLPSRLSYRVGQRIDSKVILDTMGAESLLGRGDGLFTPPGSTGLVRIHAPWNGEDEIEKVVDFLKEQREPDYDESYLRITGSDDGIVESNTSEALDPLYEQAKEVVLSEMKTSISYLQRKLQIGYNRSANIMEQLESTGILSAPNHKGNREIL